MNNNLIRIIITLMVGTMMKSIIDYLRSSDKKGYIKGQPLRGPKQAFFVGFFGYIIDFGVFALLYFNDKEQFHNTKAIICVSTFLITFFLLSLYLCLFYLNFKVEYDDDRFIKTNCLGRKCTVYYFDITKIAYSNNTFYVYSKSKKHAITPSSIGFKDFLAKIQEKTGLLVQTV